jgi:hypothetical protein
MPMSVSLLWAESRRDHAEYVLYGSGSNGAGINYSSSAPVTCASATCCNEAFASSFEVPDGHARPQRAGGEAREKGVCAAPAHRRTMHCCRYRGCMVLDGCVGGQTGGASRERS